MQHYDLLIVTPGSDMVANYVISLTETLAECHKRGISYKFLNAKGSLVHNTRESALTGSMNLNPNDKGPLNDTITYNKMFWIDSDIEWTVKDFFKLYDTDLDVVSGAYLLADGVTTTVCGLDNAGSMSKRDIRKLKGLTKIQSLGFGFVCVKSGVFEKIPRPWFALLTQEIKNDRGEKLHISLGEDISWCIKVLQTGFDIWFDPEVLVTHIKTNRVTWM